MREENLQIQDRDDVLLASEDIVWRGGKKPRYTETNRVLHTQTRMNHPKGSLEDIVQNLVRTLEMEITYKLKPEQWTSIVLDEFVMVANNGPEFTAQDALNHGTYNLFLGDSAHYKASEETFASSHRLFKDTFSTGFVWEVMEVYSGPPNIAFKWRHWGKFDKSYKGHAPSGEIVEMVGLSVVKVTEDLKLTRVEHFFDTSEFLQELVAGSKCPMAKKQGQAAAGESV